MRKYTSTTRVKTKALLLIGTFLLVMFLLPLSHSATAWTPASLTSNPAEAPTIDGHKGLEWQAHGDVNISRTELEGGRGITLHVLHSQNHLYLLVEVRFTTAQEMESLALYFAPEETTDKAAFVDRKVIYLSNVTQPGNESSVIRDYHRDTDIPGSEWVEDVPGAEGDGITFEGAAGIHGVANYRYYEFKIPFSPPDQVQDVGFDVGSRYGLYLGLASNHDHENVRESQVIILQVGPTGLEGDLDWEEFRFDPELFMNVTLIIISIVVGGYAVFLLANKKIISGLELEALQEELGLDEEREEPKKQGGK